MKLDFPVAQTGERDETKFTEDGKQKVRTVFFKGVCNDGLVIKIALTGPKDVVEKKFMTFPMGAGIDTTMSLNTTQTTLTNALTSAVTPAPADKSAAAGTPSTLEDIQASLQEIADESE